MLTCSIARALLTLAAALLAACRPPAADTRTPVPASLPSCAPGAPESFPCQLPYDAEPVVEPRPALLAAGTRTPHVWIFVDEGGAVKAAEIGRSAGVAYDRPAVALAKGFRFRPATLGGRAVPAWVLLSVATTAEPESCPSMGVPLSAGVAAFVDSAVLERPELGTLYRFAEEEEVRADTVELRFDVFIYPAAEVWGSPEEQGEAFLKALEIGQQRGRFRSFEVLGKETQSVSVDNRGRAMKVPVHTIRVMLETAAGPGESYFAVFPYLDRNVKIRVTSPPSGEARRVIDEFLRQLVSALVRTAPNCR